MASSVPFRYLHQRIGSAPTALWLRGRYGRGPCLAFPPRSAQSGKELLQRRHGRVQRRYDRLVDEVHDTLLPYPHLPQQPDRVESSRQLGNAVAYLRRCSGIGEQPLAWRGRRPRGRNRRHYLKTESQCGTGSCRSISCKPFPLKRYVTLNLWKSGTCLCSLATCATSPVSTQMSFPLVNGFSC